MKTLIYLIVLLISFHIEGKESSRWRKYSQERPKYFSINFDPQDPSFDQNWPSSRFSWLNRERNRRRKDNPRLKPKYNVIRIDRKSFFYWDSVYEKWSNWTKCDPVTCLSTRFRKCKDNSWEQLIRDLKVEAKCPVNFIYERRKCTDLRQCKIDANATSDTITKLPKVCGRKPEYIETKIIGGKESAKNSWPWHGGLFITIRQRTPMYICGATLINPGWAITAAHCLKSIKISKNLPAGEMIDTKKYYLHDKFKLVFGDHDLTEKEKTERSTRISHIILHPQYHTYYTSNVYDIALLKLETIIPRAKGIDFACVPDDVNYTLNNSAVCKAIGWGHLSSQDPIDMWYIEFGWPFDITGRQTRRKKSRNANTLQEVEMPLVDFEKCQEVYDIFNLKKDIHLCAGSINKDTCSGDSGGGLFCMDPNTSRWQLYGITNFGSSRGCGNTYGIYVRVATLVDWIKKTLENKLL